MSQTGNISKRRLIFGAFLFLASIGSLVSVLAYALFNQEVKTIMAVSGVAYSLAAVGFLAVLVWAFLRGQFKDIEEPKHQLFDIEERR